MDIEIRFPLLGLRKYLKPKMSEEEYSSFRTALKEKREDLRAEFDEKEYNRADLAWYHHAYIEHFTLMYDKSFYEPEKGYRIDEFLEKGEREFGGFDIILLWHASPRIGYDDRNQFDFYRDMPGGLEGLRRVVQRAHERGVKVFIDYNPWDIGTRREGKPDHEAIAEIVAAIEADGVFLDTMSGTNPEMRKALDQARAGVVFETEGSPVRTTQGLVGAQLITGSWGDPSFREFFWSLRELLSPIGTILTLKWLEPRHIVRVINRNIHDRYEHITASFFNGSGIVVWENVFGWWNPWSPRDRALLRKCVSILRAHKESFAFRDWEPLVPTLDPRIIANYWKSKDETVWTLVNLGFETVHKEVLAVPSKERVYYFDAWNKIELKPRQDNGMSFLTIKLEPRSAGCVVETKSRHYLRRFPVDQGSDVYELTSLDNHKPEPVAPTPLASKGKMPPEMVLIPGGKFTWRVEHRQHEGACYGDISFIYGNKHEVHELKMKAFLMDKFPVTNADYKEFLDASGYEPAEKKNFLKHWIKGEIPPGKEKHPVVYVDINDARAYAKWAGKRLPTEEEWQYAAQGTDDRFWPWGNKFDPEKCNTCSGDTRLVWGDESVPKQSTTTLDDTTPVDAFPLGQSPFGVWDLAGNVWEMTESERDDGHTRYIILKGGSYYRAMRSHWYYEGGAQRCTWHAKFLLMWPGLDRCATIGFRCVKDIEP